MKLLSIEKPIERKGKWVIYFTRKTRRSIMKNWMEFISKEIADKKYQQLSSKVDS